MMLMIQGQMGVIRTNSLGFLVILLCVSLAISLYYRKVGEEAFLNQLVDTATGEIDENQAESLWISCRQHLNDLKEALEDPKLRLLDKTLSTTNDINTKDHSLENENIQELINALHPHLKQALSDCIRKNNLLFKASGDDGDIRTRYTRCFESLFRCHDVPRRTLATHYFSPSSQASLHPTPDDEADLLDYSSPAHRDSDHEGNDNSTTIIVACVMTSVVTAVVAALVFFLCCHRDFGAKQNDEKPLLSLSLSEFSCGSSHAYAFEFNEEKLGHQLFGNESSLHKKASTNGKVYIESDAPQISLDGESAFGAAAAKASAESSDTSGNTNLPLPLPPGRVVTSPTVLPPLKCPPGRADPLPPEPPAPIRASPPPPLPPSFMKPASANVSSRPPGPPPPPLPPGAKAGPPRPPPPSTGLGPPRPPPPMPLGSKLLTPPTGPKRTPNASSDEGSGSAYDAYAPKAKLKPFFWDKVTADPDHSMVWNQLKAGSFQFSEEMIETLFGYAPVDKNKNDGKKQPSTQASMPQFIQLIDPKKAQNLAILLRALNVTTEEVCDALREGNELPVELIQTILKMAPTADEELKLRLFTGEISQLGPAERFLKVLVDIPFAFKRLESLLFMCSLHEEVTVTKESFQTLEVASKELRSSRLFLKLLEAVLKTGNRMNDGTYRGGAQAFKLDTLLKLSDVKGVDGKTTLLHFVVQEIIRTEGLRAARVARESKSFTSIKSEDLLEDVSPDTEEHYRSLGLQVVLRLSSELGNIKKAAALDAENLTGAVAKLGHGLLKARDFLNTEMKSTEEESGFHETLESFVKNAEPEVMWLLEEEKRIMALVKSTGDYFHGNAQKNEGLRLFVIVRDFLIILDKVCKEVRDALMKPVEAHKKPASNTSPFSESRIESPSPDPHKKIFPAIAERRMDNFSSSSSSDDDT